MRARKPLQNPHQSYKVGTGVCFFRFCKCIREEDVVGELPAGQTLLLKENIVREGNKIELVFFIYVAYKM